MSRTASHIVSIRWMQGDVNFGGDAGVPYTEDAKFEQRKFSSKSLQGDFGVPKQPNATENVLKMEVEAAKEILRQCEDAGVTLTVMLTDIFAQENPREASDPSHQGHFSHFFNIVMCQSAEPCKFETRIYSAHVDKNIKSWVNDKYILVDVDKFVEHINQIENAQTWTRDVDEIWLSLFGVTRPLLCRKKWPIKTSIQVLQSIFDVQSLKASVALFDVSNWTLEDSGQRLCGPEPYPLPSDSDRSSDSQQIT